MAPSGQEDAGSFGQPAARATLLGVFQLTAPGGDEIEIPNRRARAVLAMLCLTAGQPIERDTLSKLLWPGRFTAHARASLRQCLLELGKLLAPLGPDILRVTRHSIALRPGAVRTDLDAAEAGRGDPAVATELLAAIRARPILDQMDFGEPFNGWLARQRQAVEHRLGGAAGRPAPPPTSPRSAGRNAIAVLPFRALTSPDGHDYFADGMVDELITALGQAPQLLVAGRTSSFHFRGSELAPATIAEMLGVSHLIEGSVQRQGDRVRIHVHLIAGDTGFELWGGRFDGTLDDIFALQEDVAQAVMSALALALGVAMRPPVIQGPTHSKAAYDLYLQGRALCSRVFGDGVLDRAIGLLEQSLALDPEFADCWVMLAEAHQLVAVYTQCPDRPAACLRMADCARRALALSPTLGYAHALLGVYQWTQRDIVGALDHAFEGWRLEPDNPAVTMRLASFLVYCGRTGDAAPYVAAAVDQDPIDPRKHALVWSVHMSRGELEAAREVGQRIVDLGFPSVYLACATAALGDHARAVDQYRLTQRLVNTIILPPAGAEAMTPEAMDAYWQMAARGVCSGEEAARQIYRQMLEFMYATLPDKGDLAIAGPAVFLGDAELTFRALGEHVSAANMLAFISLWTKIEPGAQIWRHPEFIPFARRIGMTDAWDKYGWPDLLLPQAPA